MTARIVVIGAGQAGASLVARLRALGHEGAITLIGDEPVAALSAPAAVQGLSSGRDGGRPAVPARAEFYAEHGITLRLGAPVTAHRPRRPQTVMLRR